MNFVKSIFTPKLVKHIPGVSRVYKNKFGYKKSFHYDRCLADGKNRRLIMNNGNFLVKMSKPIMTRLNMCKSFLGIPISEARKTVISDGKNLVINKIKGLFKNILKKNEAYAVLGEGSSISLNTVLKKWLKSS